MKLKIFNYETVTSTNDEAMTLIKEKNKKRGYVHAIKQTKGKTNDVCIVGILLISELASIMLP